MARVISNLKIKKKKSSRKSVKKSFNRFSKDFYQSFSEIKFDW